MKTAIVTGVSGQDGSWLAEFLLKKDYKVYGIKRRTSSDNLWRIRGILDNPNLEIIKGDLRITEDIKKAVSEVDTVIQLACISNDPSSDLDPNFTHSINQSLVVPAQPIPYLSYQSLALHW